MMVMFMNFEVHITHRLENIEINIEYDENRRIKYGTERKESAIGKMADR